MLIQDVAQKMVATLMGDNECQGKHILYKKAKL